MALDHSRLGLENKFLENKSGRIFCARQVYLTKSCQQVWERVNQPLKLFIHHIWGETVPWGVVFIIQSSDRMQYFTILQYKLHSFNIQVDRSTRGLLAKPLTKFPKSPIRLAGSHFWQAFDTRGILTTPASDIHERLKTNGTAIKKKRLLTINNKRKIIRWKLYKDNNFH